MQTTTQATFGQRLHFLRKYRNISLQELSDATGISRSNLNRYERDASRPTTEFLKQLCAYYRVSSDYLLFGARPEELEQSGWSRFDPELKAMLERLVAVMTSENPHLRSWAIVQFQHAFNFGAGGKKSPAG